jgi:hypothetical protein
MPQDTEFEEIDGITSSIDDDNDAQMQRVLSEFDATDENVSLQIKVYRISTTTNVKGQKEKFLFYADPAELPLLEKIRDQYGSGIYRIRIYKTVGKKTEMVRAFDFEIEAAAIIQQPERQNAQSGMSEILAEIREQNKQTMQFFERVFERREERPQTPVINPMEMMQQTLEMAASLAGLRGNQAPAPSGPSPSDMMGLIKMGMEISENSGPSAKSGPMDIIGRLLTPEVLQTIFQQQPTPQMHNIPPGIQMNNAPQMRNPQPSIPWQMQLISELVPQLVAAAQRNADVTEGAEWLLSKLPPDLAEQVLSDKEFLPKLEVGVPQIVPYHGWFAATLDTARKLLTDDELRGDNPNPGRPSRSAGDDESHAPDTPQGDPRSGDGTAT